MKIVERGDKFCVVDNGKCYGRYTTEERALYRLNQIQVSKRPKKPSDMPTLVVSYQKESPRLP